MLVRVVLNIDKEPFFKLKYGLNYLKDGYFFPSYKKIDFRSKIIVKTEANFKYVHYNAQQVCYPLKWPDRLIVENFNNLINEQTAEVLNVNPHKYLSAEELNKDWVVYDIGAAEGSQSKFWTNSVKKIVLFEPLPSFFDQLKNTFESELQSNKVIIINAGISDSQREVVIEGRKILFDTLENLISHYNLPAPDYIKADIEGEELNFLTSSLQYLKNIDCKMIQITTYHRPDDYINIPKFFSNFKGEGFLSNGVMVFNRDGMINGSYRKKLYHPIFRKCLYTFKFSKD